MVSVVSCGVMMSRVSSVSAASDRDR